jgi:hypothetical protein
VLNMHPIARDTGRRSGVLGCLEIFRGNISNTSFVLRAGVTVIIVGSSAKI